MTSVTLVVRGQSSGGALDHACGVPLDLVKRRTGRRRLQSIIAGRDRSAFSPSLRVTVSAGIAMPDPKEASDAILARAGRALHAAKAQGRNRIISLRSDRSYPAHEEAAGPI
jgi:GGDEF domain-containing protein